ncbi:hypothetical protein D3P07_00585 [Paenibacillus sp. 1011MAR3C5]|uniref:hypothetical protein n=1 Tax=Paenibacillus sp. 1011MAR3C5 TaxID=1675787 RepID=UPI000E6C5538|nr:hypothetical protein [Paenibacillus sp. 1011MAR3C5]RJE90640.1 hypothetical protein D3P07_00585 [Paenibacillus sp. 1011MAR3C5]
MNSNFYVAGRLIVPIYLEVQESCTKYAIQAASKALSTNTISVLHGNIHTWNGKEYPIIANRIHVDWYETVKKEEMI